MKLQQKIGYYDTSDAKSEACSALDQGWHHRCLGQNVKTQKRWPALNYLKQLHLY